MDRRFFLKSASLTGAFLALNPLSGLPQVLSPSTNDGLKYGVAWYPEHWPEEQWKKDIELMKQLSFNVVRVGEFAWSRMEPAEDRFELDWLQRAIDLAYKNGLSVVIGTPTASPPAWLTSRYPEVLRHDEGGKVAIHGGRGHFNPASPKYLELCAKIAQKLGERFGKHPGVIGWQIDNEYWPFSFDAHTRSLFQKQLQDTYKTLDNLNQQWGNGYWSQDYSSWSQIPLSLGWQNPCLLLAVKRFKSQIIGQYQHTQVAALRPLINKSQWITTNFHGTYQHADGAELSRELDLASFDPYVGSGHLNPYEMGFNLDRLRGFKNQSFWIMETQPGHVNWAKLNNELNPGETRRMIWHQVAHGADAVLYWQWRSHIGGQEQYHGALLGQSGELKPIAKEIGQIGKELSAVAKQLSGLKPNTQTAIWITNDDQWALADLKHHPNYDYLAYAQSWYEALRAKGIDVDIVQTAADLTRYKLILAPSRYVMSPADAEALLNAAKNGAQVVLGARSGRKDVHNALLVDRQPGLGLHNALGAFIEEFYALENPIGIQGKIEGQGKVWAEWITPVAKDTEVLATYSSNPWLKDKAAVVARKVGKGGLAYIGCWPDKKPMAALMQTFLDRAGIAYEQLPEGVERSTRSGKGVTYTFWINHSEQAATINAGQGTDILTNKKIAGSIALAPDEVLVVKQDVKK